MNKALKANLLVIALIMSGLVYTSQTQASPIKNWTSNEYVTYTDLNNALNHLHANLGHGHGPIITANDISSSAGIRPEQTTFGSFNKLMAVGTWKENPDGGNIYVPINAGGDVTLTLTKLANGYRVQGTAQSGTNSDGGSEVYTIIQRSADVGFTIVCSEDTTAVYSSPLNIPFFCLDVAPNPTVARVPRVVAIEVYNNKVTQ